MKYITIKDGQHFAYSHKLGLEISVPESTARMYSLYEIGNNSERKILQNTEWENYQYFSLKACKNGKHFSDEQIGDFAIFMKTHQEWAWRCLQGTRTNTIFHRGITFGYAKFESKLVPFTTMMRTSRVLSMESTRERPSSCWQVQAVINVETLNKTHNRYLESVDFSPYDIGAIDLHYGYHDNKREYDNDITKLFDKIIKDNNLIQKRDKAIYSIKS